MRKTNLFGATILALTTSAWSLNAVAQTPAPAPMAAPAPAPAPEPAAPAPEATPAAPAPDASAPATPKAPKKKMMHHKTMHTGKLAPTKAGDKAVEDLNDASLNAAKTGKPFMAPTTPEAAKKEAHMKPAKKHMKKMAKPAAPATPPADTTTK